MAQYNGKSFFKIPRPLLLEGGVNNETVTGNVTLDGKSSLFQMIDGGLVNRNLTLPPEKDGRMFIILNAGTTNTILVQDDAAAGVITLSPGEMAWIVSDGSAWYPVLNVNNN